LNAARSAFCSIVLDASFFDSYKANNTSKRCKVLLKPCVSVFKSSNIVERTTLRIDERESRLIIDILCKLGIKKLYKLTYEETEMIQAVFNKDNCPHQLLSKSRLLQDAIVNFSNNIEEITLVAQKSGIKLKSYIDDPKAISKLLQTETSLSAHDFEEYRFSAEGTTPELTFTLKELKAILSFCEQTNLPVSVHYERAGRPVIFSLNFYGALVADFVLATLQEQLSQSDVSGTPASVGSAAPSKASSQPPPQPPQQQQQQQQAAQPQQQQQQQQQQPSVSSNKQPSQQPKQVSASRVANSEPENSRNINIDLHMKRPISDPEQRQKKQADSNDSGDESPAAYIHNKKSRTNNGGTIALPSHRSTVWISKTNDDDDDDNADKQLPQ